MRTWWCMAPGGAVSGGLLLAGCGTIDQVPLVYASTVKVGLSAEGGTPQVPGAKVVIGIESTDVAMVPTAIGRTCRNIAAHDCDKQPVTAILGSNDISPAAFVALAQAKADAVKAASRDIQRLQGELNTAASVKAAAQANRDLVAADEARLAKLKDNQKDAIATARAATAAAATAAGTAPPTTTPPTPYDGEIATLTAAVAGHDAANQRFDDAAKTEQLARTGLDAAYLDFDRSQRQLADALSNHPDATGERHDALSVFGSFDADASAKASAETGGGVKLGKSFSTGIAAQLLTEGLKQAASSTAASNCLKQAMALDAKYSAAVPDAVKACAGGIK